MMSDLNSSDLDLIRSSGAELITSLYGLFKTLKVFDIDNKSAQSVFEKFNAVAARFLASEDSVEIQLVGNQFFINQNKVAVGYAGYDAFNAFAHDMTERGIGTVILKSGFSGKEIAAFARAFIDFQVSEAFNDKPFDEFAPIADRLNLEHIEIRKLIVEETVGSMTDEDMEDEVAAFLKTVYVVLKIFESAQKSRKVNLTNAKRAVQKLVSVTEEHPDRMVTLLKIADLKNYLAFHSVNTAVYAIMIAERIGLSKVKRSLVGICGLFHDLGMLTVDESILNCAGSLSAEQWAPIWKHPAEGTKMLLRTERIVEAMTRSMQAAFQHQMRDDEMGYPRLERNDELNLFTKIVKVADGFDAMTQDRPYRRAMTEAQALQELLSLTDTVYERIFIKILANVLGVYPIGVSVKLNTGEMGMVHEENPDPDYKDKPVVRVYADAHGRRIDKVVDLMEKEMGIFKYWIVPFDEKELDLDVSDFISVM